MHHPAKLCFLVALVLAPTIARTQQPADSLPPLPPALASAKTVFVSNAGADSGLFPSPFSGDTERGYIEFYNSLKSSGAFALVNDPSDADLVLELRLLAPYGPSNANKQNGTADPRPMFRLTVYDRKTHYVLWTITESIELAVLQKTHDRNFDQALTAVLSQFLAITGKPALPPH
jgi:hypothetical protein